MIPHSFIRTTSVAMLAVVVSTSAFAQTSPVTPQPGAPNMPAPHTTVPDKIEPDSTGTLSDRLNKSDGVITPPGDIDAQIRTVQPAPDAGTMPVIRPPGTDGRSTIQPK